MARVVRGNFKMADDREEKFSNFVEESKETRASNKTSPKFSSLASPLNKRRDSSQIQQVFHCKRAKFNKTGDEVSDLELDKKDLEIVLRKKEDVLRKLKLVKMYRSKSNLSDLEDLISKWRSICQQAAQDLYEKFSVSKERDMTMGEFLDGMRVNHELIRYCKEDESFY